MASAELDLDVRDVPERSRFEGDLEGERVAFLDYRRRDDGTLLLTHAEVSPRVGGRGVGTAFVSAVLDQLADRGERIVPICGFVASVLRQRPELASLRP